MSTNDMVQHCGILYIHLRHDSCTFLTCIFIVEIDVSFINCLLMPFLDRVSVEHHSQWPHSLKIYSSSHTLVIVVFRVTYRPRGRGSQQGHCKQLDQCELVQRVPFCKSIIYVIFWGFKVVIKYFDALCTYIIYVLYRLVYIFASCG